MNYYYNHESHFITLNLDKIKNDFYNINIESTFYYFELG
jgi:hypothetical protein